MLLCLNLANSRFVIGCKHWLTTPMIRVTRRCYGRFDFLYKFLRRSWFFLPFFIFTFFAFWYLRVFFISSCMSMCVFLGWRNGSAAMRRFFNILVYMPRRRAINPRSDVLNDLAAQLHRHGLFVASKILIEYMYELIIAVSECRWWV